MSKQASEDIVLEWSHLLMTAPIQVYTEQRKIASLSGNNNLRKKLKEINSDMYGCGLEEIAVNDKLFAQSGFKEIVAQIAMGKATISGNYSYLRIISSTLESQGIWNDPNYTITQPEHPVSKMKLKVQEVMDKGFNINSAVRITDIWNALEQPPFGLMPCTGSVFLLGFLLKDYADSTYYKRDINNNTVSLNYTDLSELIYGVVKDLPKVKGQLIVKQKPEHIEFCRITGDIFKISKEERNPIDDISKNLRIYLTNNNYPLWALTYYIEEKYYDHAMKEPLIKIVNLFCEFVNPENYINRDKTKIAEDIYSIYKTNPGIDTILGEIVGCDCLREGMVYYIASYKPEVTSLASRLKIDSNEYLSMLNTKFSDDSSYLWKIGDTNHQIDDLYNDLRLIAAINRVLSTNQKDFQDAKNALTEKLNIIKIPVDYLIEECPELKRILRQFNAIKDNKIADCSIAADIIESDADEFLSTFNNQLEIFGIVIHKHVDSSATDEEIEVLFNNVDSGTLFKSTDEFNVAICNSLKSLRRSEKNRQLLATWQAVTNTKNPQEWSQINRIPILCAFGSDLSFAQKVFNALNGEMTLQDKEIDKAIEFVKSSKMEVLKDKKYCEKMFITYFCGEYSYVVEDANSLRDILREIAGNNVYEWYAKRQISEEPVKALAKELYQAKFKNKAREKIHCLSAAESQQYLETLIETDTLLGISILKSK